MRPDPARRALVLVLFAALWIVVLLLRLLDLQVLRHDEFVKRARKQQEMTLELPPRRGPITDREGRPLAVTPAVDSFFAIPSEIADADATAAALAPLLGQNGAEIRKKLQDPERDWVWIARRLPEETAKRILAKKLPGIRPLKEFTRRYPQGALLASVLGWVGSDNQGLAGLEFKFDADVRGRPARITLLRDAARRSYAEAGGSRMRATLAEGVEGASLQLTIDSAIQHAVERELKKAAEVYRTRGASAVVMDPGTGEILALASYPTFDPNRPNEADGETRRCRPVADVYEPGSTFKVVAASSALDAGTIAPDDLVDCGGGVLSVGNVTIHEHGHNRWSVLSLADVLAHSSNIGIAHVALALGRGPFYKSVKAFGFGQKTGVDLDGETAGLLRDTNSWSALTLPTMSFGQEIGVTVLQMARAYSAIASGGLLPTPYLVAEVRRPDGTVAPQKAKTFPRVLSPKTARSLSRLLSRVVDVGTGKLAAIPGYTVAGKTGTAQKAIPGGGYSRDRFVASFIGFTPLEKPRVVIAVVLDEPKGKIYGGDVAAPVFSAIGAETLAVLHEPAREMPDTLVPAVLTADLGRGASGPLLTGDLVPAANRASRSDESEVVELLGDQVTVPNVTGRSAAEAVRLLTLRSLLVKLSGHGFVAAQEPAGGAFVAPGSACELKLSMEPSAASGKSAVLLSPSSGEVAR